MSKVLPLHGEWALSCYRRGGYLWGEAPEFTATAHVPGSVQSDLAAAGLMPDPLLGVNSRYAEWTEHRDFLLERTFTLPEERYVERVYLCCEGLDHQGTVRLNGHEVARLPGMHLPLRADITAAVHLQGENRLQICFDAPPEVTGQLGKTHEERALKARYAYGWDWCPRMVSTGIWDDISVRTTSGLVIDAFWPRASLLPGGGGRIQLHTELEAHIGGRYAFHYRVLRGGELVASLEAQAELRSCRESVLHEMDLPGPGVWDTDDPVLYEVRLRVDRGQICADSAGALVGFRELSFTHVAGRTDALAYQCRLNGRDIYLTGVNWAPFRMYPGNVCRETLAPMLSALRAMGVRILRVWGGAVLEKAAFYDLCDELGLLVWQEFPLSSSGLSNRPPEDDAFLDRLEEVAASFVRRRRAHPCLAAWSGGNELLADDGRPLDERHPAIARLGRVVRRLDEGRCFFPTSPSGAVGMPGLDELGRGVCHDVHGPWKYLGVREHYAYYNRDDCLLRSESGAPGAARLDLLERYSGGLPLWPPTAANALHAHRGAWWIQHEQLGALFGPCRGEADLPQYVRESRYLQAEAVRYMAQSCRRRAPGCAGLFVWMGNDPFPNASNTALFDYDAAPRPAAYALSAAAGEVLLCARYDRLSLAPGETFRAEVLLAAPAASALRVDARLLGPRGEVLHEQTAMVAPSQPAAPCFALAAALPHTAAGVLILALAAFAGEQCVAREAYAFACAPDGPPLAPLRRLAPAQVALRAEGEGYALCNDSPHPAVGVCAYAPGGVCLPGFVTLLPWEKRPVALYGREPSAFCLEGLNLHATGPAGVV